MGEGELGGDEARFQASRTRCSARSTIPQRETLYDLLQQAAVGTVVTCATED
jgi:hypothetical protein